MHRLRSKAKKNIKRPLVLTHEQHAVHTLQDISTLSIHEPSNQADPELISLHQETEKCHNGTRKKQ